MFTTIIMDFFWMSVLLLIGFYLRKTVPLLQKLYLPASLIGGLIGLLLGPTVLGAVSPISIPWSENLGSYATPLLAITFSVMFFGVNFSKSAFRKTSVVYMVACVCMFVQVLFAGLLVMAFGLPNGFSLMPQSAFYGAHGVPGVVAGIYQSIGHWDFDEAFTVGTTFATIGLLYGVIGGVIFVNIAARRGQLKAKTLGELSEADRTGYIKPTERQSCIITITNNSTMEPLAFHVAIIGIIMLVGYWLLALIQKLPGFGGFSVTATVLIVGLVFGYIVGHSNLKNVVDGDSLRHVGNTALEFLVVSSVASTNMNVVMNYGTPIIVISVVLMILTTALTFFLAKRWFEDEWFEHAIAMFGAYTGSSATGIMLLRVADPDLKTEAMVDFATSAPFQTITLQTFYLNFAPLWMGTVAGFNNVMIGTAVALVAFLAIGFIVYRPKK